MPVTLERTFTELNSLTTITKFDFHRTGPPEAVATVFVGNAMLKAGQVFGTWTTLVLDPKPFNAFYTPGDGVAT